MKTHVTFDTKNISLIPFKHTYHRNIPRMSQICQQLRLKRMHHMLVSSVKLAILWSLSRHGHYLLSVFITSIFCSCSFCFFPVSPSSPCFPIFPCSAQHKVQGIRLQSPGKHLFVPKVHGPWHSAVPLTAFPNP